MTTKLFRGIGGYRPSGINEYMAKQKAKRLKRKSKREVRSE